MRPRIAAEAFLCGVALLGAVAANAQDIRVRVINGKNGKPVPDECMNIWIGGRRGAYLLALTDKTGNVSVHLQGGTATTDPMPPTACNGMGVGTTGPVSVPKGADAITLLPNRRVICEERHKFLPGEVVDPDKILNSYSISGIVSSGISGSNTCGEIRIRANPGELVYFVRPPTFWENMRR